MESLFVHVRFMDPQKDERAWSDHRAHRNIFTD